MLFWDELDIFIKENTFTLDEWNQSRRVINRYLKNDKRFPWEELTFSMKELLIDFEIQSNYYGLTPPNAEGFIHEYNHV